MQIVKHASIPPMPLRRDQARPTELLIVGVAHLDASVSDAALERGINLLRNWRPDLIAIECLPGHLVVEYEQRGGVFNDFPVGDAVHAREAAATVADLRPWNVWEARAIARDQATPLDDRVIGWLLAREPNNALLLPWRDASLPPDAHQLLASLANSPSERVRVGVRLARDLGHRELVHFDDHAGVEILDQIPGVMDAVDNFYDAIKDQHPQPPEPAGADQDAWLRWTWASTAAAREWLETIESAAMADHPDALLRARNAQWRTRNLAMASRLRQATALIPGGRMLAIVGHSHERPLRAALATDQHDLALTDITSLESLSTHTRTSG